MKQTSLFFLAVLFCQANMASTACDSSFKPLNETELLQLIAPLEQGVLVRSEFEQKRVMRLLKKPLLANGNMIFAPGFGLSWQLDKPFAYQLIMTAEQFTQVSGTQKQVINAADQPAMFAISKIFTDLFAGDFLTAENYFSISGKQLDGAKKNQWSLCLLPVREPFNKLLAYIEINGSKKINNVHIQDVGGDYTHITFSASAEIPLSNNNALTDVEKAYFQKH
jgi:hypothetical protein